MHHLIIALRRGSFVNNLCIKLASNMDELHWRATKYVKMEKLVAYMNQVWVRATLIKKELDKPRFTKAREGGSRDRPPKKPSYTHYTPFSVSRFHILDQALAINILAMLKGANTPPKADFSKHCQYQWNWGHSGVLKDKIEDIIKLGHLKDFFHKS